MEETGKRPREVLKYSFWDLHWIMWRNRDDTVEFEFKKGAWIWIFPQKLVGASRAIEVVKNKLTMRRRGFRKWRRVLELCIFFILGLIFQTVKNIAGMVCLMTTGNSRDKGRKSSI